jgi:hypothetical protein
LISVVEATQLPVISHKYPADRERSSSQPAACAKMFSSKHSHRTIKGGVRHNLPQEAPCAFVKAVVDVMAEA